ncbi:MAG: 16S rRNA (uracil(1498)-N(3))-methyltransferase [Acidobacteria bacterium]|nr:16S rRNA (uracil(1498)-N(3))-methyltransferase [Acidobacteriota bacterium]
MARRRFFVERVRDGSAELAGPEAAHLARVLRVEPGQRFEISDDRAVYLAEVVAVDRQRVRFRVVEELPPPAARARITLLASLIKFERMEWTIEKATELGVDTIVPVNAQRSEKGLERGAAGRIDRWRKIAREASQQSRRAHLPRILEPRSLAEAVAEQTGYRYYLEEIPGAPLLLAALPDLRTPSDSVALLIGPEGGWTGTERALLAPAWTAVSMGEGILRAETAAVAAMAILSQQRSRARK